MTEFLYFTRACCARGRCGWWRVGVRAVACGDFLYTYAFSVLAGLWAACGASSGWGWPLVGWLVESVCCLAGLGRRRCWLAAEQVSGWQAGRWAICGDVPMARMRHATATGNWRVGCDGRIFQVKHPHSPVEHGCVGVWVPRAYSVVAASSASLLSAGVCAPAVCMYARVCTCARVGPSSCSGGCGG
jgi:hypothetical protein